MNRTLFIDFLAFFFLLFDDLETQHAFFDYLIITFDKIHENFLSVCFHFCLIMFYVFFYLFIPAFLFFIRIIVCYFFFQKINYDITSSKIYHLGLW